MLLNINCKQFMFKSIPFPIFMVWDFSLKIKSESINICTKFSNCRWMKMAKIVLPKRSGKRSKVREKSLKIQGILKKILSGNPELVIGICFITLIVIFFNTLCPQLLYVLSWKHGLLLTKFCKYFGSYSPCLKLGTTFLDKHLWLWAQGFTSTFSSCI